MKSILWYKPHFNEELGEYFENLHTKEWFKQNNLIFKNHYELSSFLNHGEPKQLIIDDRFHNITTNIDEFKEELKDKEYRQSFNKMENKLITNNIIMLPSPILIINKQNLKYLFSGNRRCNLALKYSIPIKFWCVKL